jgi:ATP phosphoribosyltransferase regulatory subunit
VHAALDTMQAIGVKDYVLEIGNSEFFRSACAAVHLNQDASSKLADLIDRKSLVELAGVSADPGSWMQVR